MVIAIKTESFLSPPFDQTSLLEAINTAFLNAGFPSSVDTYFLNGEAYHVYPCVLDETKLYGTTYLRVRIRNDLYFFQQLFSSWAKTNHTGNHGGGETVHNLVNTSSQLNFVSLNGGTEYKLVIVWQGNNYFPLGYFAPFYKPDWWDLNSWNYAFISYYNYYQLFYTSNLNPYGNVTHDTILPQGRMSHPNSITNRRDISSGILFYTHTNQGISGRTSDDLVAVSASGIAKFDIVQTPQDNKEYILLYPGGGSSLGVRIK